MTAKKSKPTATMTPIEARAFELLESATASQRRHKELRDTVRQIASRRDEIVSNTELTEAEAMEQLRALRDEQAEATDALALFENRLADSAIGAEACELSPQLAKLEVERQQAANEVNRTNYTQWAASDAARDAVAALVEGFRLSAGLHDAAAAMTFEDWLRRLPETPEFERTAAAAAEHDGLVQPEHPELLFIHDRIHLLAQNHQRQADGEEPLRHLNRAPVAHPRLSARFICARDNPGVADLHSVLQSLQHGGGDALLPPATMRR